MWWSTTREPDLEASMRAALRDIAPALRKLGLPHEGYFEQFSPALKTGWVNHSPIEDSDEIALLVSDQGDAAFGHLTVEQMQRRRDDMQIALLRAKSSVDNDGPLFNELPANGTRAANAGAGVVVK